MGRTVAAAAVAVAGPAIVAAVAAVVVVAVWQRPLFRERVPFVVSNTLAAANRPIAKPVERMGVEKSLDIIVVCLDVT